MVQQSSTRVARSGSRLRSAAERRGPRSPTRLKAHYLSAIAAFGSGPQRQILAPMEETPALVDCAERMWFRHEDALVAAIAEEFGLAEPSDEIRFCVRSALYIQLLATKEDHPESTIDAGRIPSP